MQKKCNETLHFFSLPSSKGCICSCFRWKFPSNSSFFPIFWIFQSFVCILTCLFLRLCVCDYAYFRNFRDGFRIGFVCSGDFRRVFSSFLLYFPVLRANSGGFSAVFVRFDRANGDFLRILGVVWRFGVVFCLFLRPFFAFLRILIDFFFAPVIFGRIFAFFRLLERFFFCFFCKEQR